jgi:hypothetical protein
LYSAKVKYYDDQGQLTVTWLTLQRQTLEVPVINYNFSFSNFCDKGTGNDYFLNITD